MIRIESLRGTLMTKLKSLSLIVLLMLVVISGLSVCAYGMREISQEDSQIHEKLISRYNLTGERRSASTDFEADTAPEETVSVYNSTERKETVVPGSMPGRENEDSPQPDERSDEDTGEHLFENIRISESFSDEKLRGINVSEKTLKVFTGYEKWLKENSEDPDRELSDDPEDCVLYIDDDLRSIDGFRIFATRPASQKMYLDILRGAEIEESSKEEMVSFLIGFEEKYPIRYVCTGGVLFVTIENKEELFAEITEEDREKLRDISDAVFKETFGKTDQNAETEQR